MTHHRRTVAALLFAMIVHAPGAFATSVEITPDYTGLGTIRVDANGFIVSSGGTVVTNQFKAVIDTAILYWESAINHSRDITINFSVADLGAGTVGDALATSWLAGAPRHITEANIRFDNRANTIASGPAGGASHR